jgi:hypothetical protein
VIRLGLLILAAFIGILAVATVLENHGVLIFGPLLGPEPGYAKFLSWFMFVLLATSCTLILFGLHIWISNKGRLR